MPRLARKNIKVFAGSATNNGVFGSLQANNPTITSDVEQIQSLTAWGEGWNAATETSEELPPLEEIQGVEYVTTYQQAYIMQEGIPEWAATVTYYKGCLAKEVTSTGFKIYNSLTDNNTGNLLSDTSNWKKVMDSDDLYAFDGTVVHDTGNETISGTKTFSSTIAGSINGNAATVTNGVYTTGNQTIAGTKTFSSSPVLPTPSNSDSSTKGATTAYVRNLIVPKYNNATNKSKDTQYTAGSDCRIIICGILKTSGDRTSAEAKVYIDGSMMFDLYGYYVYGTNETPFYVTFDLKQNQTYKIATINGTLTIKKFIEIPF